MISEKDIPQQWKQVLASLQDDLFADAIIAGGALRDIDNARNVTDVDIFVKDIGVLDVEYISSLISPICHQGHLDTIPFEVECVMDRARFLSGTLENLGDMCGKYVYGEDINDTSHDGILREVPFAFHKAMLESFIEKVFNIKIGSGVDMVMYQIITVNKDPISYVAEDFDFGFCKILYDGVSVLYDNEYLDDKKNKVFTFRISATRTSLWRSVQHHFTKLQMKYPDYPFQIKTFVERHVTELPKLTDDEFDLFSSHAKAAKFNKPVPPTKPVDATQKAIRVDSQGYIR